MAQIEFVGQSTRDSDYITANPSRLVNVFREPIPSSGRAAYALKSVLGTSDYVALPGAFTRALGVVSDQLYAVAGGRLHSINSGSVDLGAISDDEHTSLAGNNGSVTICADGRYYVWDGAALTEPAAGAFSDFGALDYLSNYTVITEKDGRRFQWSNLANPASLPGLNFSTADGRDDDIVRPLALNGMLYLFKQNSHEIWYLTGQAGANAFARQAGGIVDIGLKGFNLVSRVPSGAFMVGADNRAYLISGAMQPVSIPAVETAIQQGRPRACFTYEDEGHTFCAITFVDRAAWVYDVATNEWHERAEGALLQPWSVTCAAKWRDNWYCGSDDAVIRLFDRVSTDGDKPLVREMTSRTMYQDGQRFIASQFEIFPRQGLTDGRVELFISRDGGMIWSNAKVATVGPVGNYSQRVIWRSLGQARQLTAKIRITGAVGFSMLSEGRIA